MTVECVRERGGRSKDARTRFNNDSLNAEFGRRGGAVARAQHSICGKLGDADKCRCTGTQLQKLETAGRSIEGYLKWACVSRSHAFKKQAGRIRDQNYRFYKIYGGASGITTPHVCAFNFYESAVVNYILRARYRVRAAKQIVIHRSIQQPERGRHCTQHVTL